MGKETITFDKILNVKNINFTTIKILLLKNDADIDNIFISKDISSIEKNFKYFFGYLDGYKIKLFTIILRKTNAFLKIYDGGAKWMFF